MMKVAIVHDFLIYWGGAERVLTGLREIFSDAPIYTLFYKEKFVKKFFAGAKIIPSFLQNVPLPRQLLLPFMPTAIESFQLENYDVVISSGNFSKGVITSPQTAHIHYCHSTPRFLWEEGQEYIADNVPFGFRTIASLTLHFLRVWDLSASCRVDSYIANSQWTATRIKKFYKKDSRIIYPFIPNSAAIVQELGIFKRKKYFLIVSRLQRYKNIELAIRACNELGLSLVIAGKGPDSTRLKKIAGKTITFLGFVQEKDLPSLYQRAKAVILPGVEDFGLTLIEAMSYGTPALAYKKGGACETIIEGKTGEFFEEHTIESFAKGLKKVLTHYPNYKKDETKKYAQRFSFDRFKEEILNIING